MILERATLVPGHWVGHGIKVPSCRVLFVSRRHTITAAGRSPQFFYFDNLIAIYCFLLLTYLPMSSEYNRRRGFAAKRATLQSKQEVARCRLLLTKSLGAEAAQSWSRGGPSSTSPHDYEISTWVPVDGDQETRSCLVENETTCQDRSSSPRADDLALECVTTGGSLDLAAVQAEWKGDFSFPDDDMDALLTVGPLDLDPLGTPGEMLPPCTLPVWRRSGLVQAVPRPSAEVPTVPVSNAVPPVPASAMVSSLKDIRRQAAERDLKDTIQRLRHAEKELVALEKLRLATRREEVNRRKFLHRTYRLKAVRDWLTQQESGGPLDAALSQDVIHTGGAENMSSLIDQEI